MDIRLIITVIAIFLIFYFSGYKYVKIKKPILRLSVALCIYLGAFIVNEFILKLKNFEVSYMLKTVFYGFAFGVVTKK